MMLDEEIDRMLYDRGMSILQAINKSLDNKQYLVYDRLLDRFSDVLEFMSQNSLQNDLYNRLHIIQQAYNQRRGL